MIAAQTFSTFAAGLLASLTPCVYPMIPITVGYFGSRGGKRRELALYTLGQIVTFTALGIFAVSLGEIFGFSSESRAVRVAVGIFFLVFGLLSFSSRLPGFLQRLSGGMQRWTWGGALGLGIASALVASPCSTPVLGGVLSLIATEGSFWRGLVLMLAFSAGYCLIFLLLSAGVVNLKRLPRSGQWMIWVHRLSSVLLVACGVYYLLT